MTFARPIYSFPEPEKTTAWKPEDRGEPRIELMTHLSHPSLDVTDAGCLSTAARAVNAIDWVCGAPPGLVGAEDIPPTAMIRGLMW